jgi:uncharacterized protein
MPQPTDPLFHPGERELQARYGSSALVEAQGTRIIRDHLNDQHRAFYPLLRQIFLGAADRDGALWATMRCGEPGFVQAPDPNTLRIDAPALPGDPVAASLHAGLALGLLGLDLTNRRRNRANGRVAALDAQGLTLAVERAFGNCPQYIQTRHPEPLAPGRPTEPAIAGECLDDAACALIAAADTFFIASQAQGVADGGVDVSHRGGKPGFVRIDDERRLTIPDFPGNKIFMTLGNLLLDPRAGLLFTDFASGDLLWLTGRAAIVWDGPEVARYAGAERLLRFELARLHRAPGALPQRWRFDAYAPQLARTGAWRAD